MPILPDIVQNVVLNSRETVGGLVVVTRGFREMGRTAARESTQAATAVEALQSRVDELGDEAKSAERKIASLNREIAQLRALSAGGGGGGGGGRRGGRGGGGDVIGELAKSAGFLGTAIKLLKIPVIIWGIGQLVVLVGALSAGLVGLTSALGPTLGAFAALPGLIAPIIQGFGSVALAVGGVKDAFSAYQKAKDAAKDATFVDAQAEAAGAVAQTETAMKSAREEATRLRQEGSWEEYSAAVANARVADEAYTAAKKQQAAVNKQANAAQKEYEEQLKKMDPSVRVFIETVEGMRSKFEAIRKQAQAGLFPGLTDALKNISTLFGPIGNIVKATTAVFGNFARDVSKMLTSDAFKKDLVPFAAENISLLEKAGDFLLAIWDALRNITMAAAPLTRWFADLVVSAGRWLKDWATVGRASGRFAAFFERTRDVLTQLGHIIRNVSGGFMAIFRAGTGLGQQMLNTWEGATRRFREWTRSAAGQKKLNEFFKAMQPILYELGRLFSSLARAFGTLWMDSNMQTAALLKQLRQELLPVFVDLLAIVGSEFGPMLISLVTNFLKLMREVVSMTGPLMFLFEALSGMFKITAAILKQVPPLRYLFVSLAAVIGLWRAFKIVSIITGLGKMATSIRAVAAAFWTLNAATVASNNAMKATMATQIAASLGGQVTTAVLRLSYAFQAMGVSSTGAQIAMARFAVGGVAILTAALAYGLISAIQAGKRAAQEFREEVEKGLDLTQYTDLEAALDRTKHKGTEAMEEWNRAGFDKAHVRLWAGFTEMLPWIDNKLDETKGKVNEANKMWDEYTKKQQALERALGPVANEMDLTIGQAQKLANELGIDLNPVLELATSSAKELDPAIEKVKEEIADAAWEAKYFTPQAREMAEGIRQITADAANATDRVGGLRKMLSAGVTSFLDSEKATRRWDAIMGKSTETVEENNEALEEWTERQKAARAELNKAKADVASLSSDLATIRQEGTYDEIAAAEERLADAIGDQAEAQAKVNEKAPISTKAKAIARDGVDLAHEAIDAAAEWAVTEYAALGANEEAGKQVAAGLDERRTQFERVLAGTNLSEADKQKYLGQFDKIKPIISAATFFALPTEEEKRRFFAEVPKDIEKFLTDNPGMRPEISVALGMPKEGPGSLGFISALAAPAATVPQAALTPSNPSGLSPEARGKLDPDVAAGLADYEAAVIARATEKDAAHRAFTMNQQYGPRGELIGFNFKAAYDTALAAWQTAVNELDAFKKRYKIMEEGGITGRAPMVTDRPILWGEGRAPEAYIPYDPQYRRRATGLLSQVARDFGLSILPRMERGAIRRFEAGGMVPTAAIHSIDSSIRKMAAGGIVGATGGPTSISHSNSHQYAIHVDATERASGEQLGRDIAWGMTQARGRQLTRSR